MQTPSVGAFPLSNQNVSAPLFKPRAQNANTFDQTQLSLDVKERPAEGDLGGLLAGLQDNHRPAPVSGRLLQLHFASGQLDPNDPLTHKQSLSQLDDKERTRMYGEQAPLMAELGAARPDMSIDDATRMWEIFDSEPSQGKPLVEFLGRRKDMSVSDAFAPRPDGRVELQPSLRDKSSRDALERRQDLKPGELSRMGNGFQAALGDPMMAAEAYQSAVPTLAKRGDLRPENMNGMMDGMVRTLGEPRASLRAFQNGTRLLSARPDVNPKEVNGLLDSVAGLGRKDGEHNPARVGNAFEQATSLLVDQPGRSIGDVTGLADMLGNKRMTPRQDATGSSSVQAQAQAAMPRPRPQQTLTLSGAQAPGGKQDRLGLFTEGLDLMRAQPDLTPEGAFLAVSPHYKPEGRTQQQPALA